MHPAATPPLDPENPVAVLRLHQESQLNGQFLAPANEGKHLLRLLRHVMQLSRQPGYRLHKREELVTILLEEFAAILERESSIAGRKQREEKWRTLPQASGGPGE